MTTVLPGATIGLLGGGENARMFALAARRMGYRVHVYSPDTDDVARAVCDGGVCREFDDLISIRQFASSVDLLTVTGAGAPASALEAAADVTLVRPSASAFEAAGEMRRAEGVEPEIEFSIIGARGVSGECALYTPIAIDRVDGVIDIARSPAAIGLRMARQVADIVRGTLEKLDLVGVACVEFAMTGEHELITGDVIPHPHSSGYLTIDACVTSQFEQQLRAICGLPLGCTELMRPAATAKFGSALWEAGEPDWASACALPAVKLHLHGPRSGHLTATASSATLAKQIVRAARLALTRT